LLVTSPQVYAAFDGTRFIVSWVGVQRYYDRAGPFTFQALLYPDGEIRFQYLDMPPQVSSGTIAIQDEAQTDGLTVVSNQLYIHNGLAVALTVLPHWLSVGPTQGTVAAGDSM